MTEEQVDEVRNYYFQYFNVYRRYIVHFQNLNLTVSFVYFGLTFIVKTVEMPITSSSKLTIPEIRTLIPDVVSIIEREKKCVEKVFGKFLKNKKLEPHFFKVNDLLWIYCHGHYVKMSDVTVSLLIECGIPVSVCHTDESLFECTNAAHKSHIAFEPFLRTMFF